MLYIILAYSSIELVPKLLLKDREVIKKYKRRGKDPKKSLLDISIVGEKIKVLDEWWMRGRPDIIHITLLNIFDSILNREGFVKVYIHTRNDEIIYIKPETRLPRNYNRFVGLIESLYDNKYVPSKDFWLLKLEKKKLGSFLREIDAEKVILLDENGKYKKPKELAEELIEKDVCIIVGGFQRGKFPKWIYGLATDVVSIYKETLTTNAVVNEIIVNLENEIIFR